MIRLSDALLLASTKLRTRKVRTIVTAVMASLIFAVIIFVFALSRGMIDSYRAFTSSGLSEKYVANVMYFDWMDGDDLSSAETIAAAKARHVERVAAKTAEAKRLGLEYDPKSEPAVTTKNPDDIEYLNQDNQTVMEILAEQRAEQPTVIDRATKIAADYNPITIHKFRQFGDTSGLVIMKDGKEDLDLESKSLSPQQQLTSGQQVQNSIGSLGYLPLDLVEPYILDGADRTQATEATDQIPVIVPYSQVEAALGLKALERDATNQQKLERLDEVKRRVADTLIDACYRNESSRQQIEMTKIQLRERQRPAAPGATPLPVEYALPADTSCGEVTISTDRRSAAERDYQSKQTEFDRKFGDETEPVQRKLTFRIIGIAPDAPNWENLNGVQSLVMSFGGSSLSGMWVVPEELVAEDMQAGLIPAVNRISEMFSWTMQAGVLVEFSNAHDIRQFKDEQGCNGWPCGGKPEVAYFGSNSVLIDDITSKVIDFMKWVVLVVAAIAAVLMTGMAGRVITDSRRETAVFRAIGARRNDIRLIYMLYILMFSGIVALIAIALGLLAAWGISIWQAESLTTMARLMFIESDYTGQYHLVGIWPLMFAAVAGVIIFTGFAAILLPLSRNLVRSPLRDMRDE